MGKARKSTLMGNTTKEISSAESKMGLEKYSGPMETNTLGSSSRIRSAGRVRTTVICYLGAFTWYDGRNFQGDFKDGKMHGKGSYFWPDGSRYIGEYERGKRHGWGVYTALNGMEYEGTWNNGVQDGYGYFIPKEGEKKRKSLWLKGAFVKWVGDKDETSQANLGTRAESLV